MNNDKQNPYAAPKAKLERFDLAQAYTSFKPFSTTGRIGRLRYISFTLGIISLAFIITFFAAPIPLIGFFLSLLVFGVALVINLFLSIQRCHDFNMTGWLAIISLIPVVALVLYIIPGTKAENQFGPKPPENSIAVIISSILFMFIFVSSIALLFTYYFFGSV